MKGKLVILSGCSGVGKDTVLNAWIQINPRVKRVVSYTTRLKREGEQDGIDYFFITTEEFEKMIGQNAFLEYKKVYGNLYGTPLSLIQKYLEEGCYAILKIDVQGALEVMALCPDMITIFLAPPSKEELEQRIRMRATENSKTIKERLEKSHWEMSQSSCYQHIITNKNVDQVVFELERIIK